MESLVDDFATFYIAGMLVTFGVVFGSCDHTTGKDTTGNTMSFALILVHQHPEVLDRYACIV